MAYVQVRLVFQPALNCFGAVVIERHQSLSHTHLHTHTQISQSSEKVFISCFLRHTYITYVGLDSFCAT